MGVTLIDTLALRKEAAIEPAPVHTGEVTKETQVIAIYGKGGSGKSFALSNLSYMMAQQGKRVLLIGCDPKSDTTSLLFGGKSCPTIIETSARKKLAGEEVRIEDVCFTRDGGFGLPIARDMCQKVIVVGSNDLQSLYVANNVCSAVEYFRKLGGNVGVAGMVINEDDGTGEAAAFAEAVGIPVLAAIPADEDIRRKSANYQIIGIPGDRWGGLFEALAQNVAEALPVRPKPLTQDGLLGLFSADQTGASYVLTPASQADMRGVAFAEKASLEVIYDAV
jgi:chlorophyllide a reductase subunit X